MNHVIEVRLNVKNMPLHDGPKTYFKWLEKRLRKAGVPVNGDKLSSGTLRRLDDPRDFGATVYRWEPNEAQRPLQ